MHPIYRTDVPLLPRILFIYIYSTDIFKNFIFGRASNLYLCLYNQLFALYYYVFKFLTPSNCKTIILVKTNFLKKLRHISVLFDYLQEVI